MYAECETAGVAVRCSTEVQHITRSEAGWFDLQTNQGALRCKSLVIATGGISIRPLGATEFGYRVAEQFGLKIEPPRPGLVPLTLPPKLQESLRPLSGVSVDVIVSCDGQEFREHMLVTTVA